MTFRLVVLFIILMAVSTVASAACLTCVPRNLSGDGTCQPSSDGRCTYTCCLSDPGQNCVVDEHRFNCGEEAIVPTAYFATALPMQTEGSALRLRLGNGKPIERKPCDAIVALQKRS